MLYFFVVIIIHVVNAQGCAMTVVAGCVKCGPATRNSQNLAPLLLHKPVHQSHPTVLVNKKSGNTKAVYIVLHSHVVHLFCTLHARYTNHARTQEF